MRSAVEMREEIGVRLHACALMVTRAVAQQIKLRETRLKRCRDLAFWIFDFVLHSIAFALNEHRFGVMKKSIE